MTTEILEVNPVILKQLLNDNPLSSTEHKELQIKLASCRINNLFFYHGLVTGESSAPQMATAPLNSPIEETCIWLSNRFGRSIHLSLLIDTFFLPLIDYAPLTPEHFLENRLEPHHIKNLQAWCIGYLASYPIHKWFENGDERIKRLIEPLTFLLANRPSFLKRVGWEHTMSPKELAEKQQAAMRELPALIIQIYDFWRVQAPRGNCMRNAFREIPKNAPCPCLGGQPYKKCCGISQHRTSSSVRMFVKNTLFNHD